MERWLLLSNCQTFGLADSINFMSVDCEVTGIDIWDYAANLKHYYGAAAVFDRVIAHPEVLALAPDNLSQAKALDLLPGIHFEGYHPDICFAEIDGKVLKGPLQDYQSLIALAAYTAGMSVSETVSLYNGKVFQKCGYLDAWKPAREKLFHEFSSYGYNLQETFAQWVRRGPFMYSTNHPCIDSVYSIARLFLRDRPIRESHLRPRDNLATGPCYPIFPEIGEALGVEGSTLFKPLGAYKYLSLEEYIRASFDLYDSVPRKPFGVGGYADRYRHVQAVVEGETQ